MREKLLFGPGAELTHVLVGLDGLVPELEAVFGAFRADAPNVKGPDYVTEVIEFQWTTRRIGQADGLQRCHEFILVAGIAARRFEGRIDNLAINVKQSRILARDRLEIFQHATDEALIG